MQRVFVLVLVMLTIASPASAEDVAGVVVDDVDVGIPLAVIRVVGEKLVITTTADENGQFRVTGLPEGTYRVEVERGTVTPPRPPPKPFAISSHGGRLHLDQQRIRCCICAMERAHRLEALRSAAAPKRGPIDTRSTAQGIVIQAPGR